MNLIKQIYLEHSNMDIEQLNRKDCTNKKAILNIYKITKE